MSPLEPGPLFFSERTSLIVAAIVLLTVVIVWTLAVLDSVYATVALVAAGFGVVTAISTWPSSVQTPE